MSRARTSAAPGALATEVVDSPCEVTLHDTDANLGCKRRVSSGISWVFAQADEAIVLEDDCLPHPSFFPYCDELLDRYRDDERVMHIGGVNLGRHVGRATLPTASRRTRTCGDGRAGVGPGGTMTCPMATSARLLRQWPAPQRHDQSRRARVLPRRLRADPRRLDRHLGLPMAVRLHPPTGGSRSTRTSTSSPTSASARTRGTPARTARGSPSFPPWTSSFRCSTRA